MPGIVAKRPAVRQPLSDLEFALVVWQKAMAALGLILLAVVTGGGALFAAFPIVYKCCVLRKDLENHVFHRVDWDPIGAFVYPEHLLDFQGKSQAGPGKLLTKHETVMN